MSLLTNFFCVRMIFIVENIANKFLFTHMTEKLNCWIVQFKASEKLLWNGRKWRMAEQQVDNFYLNAIITPNNRTWILNASCWGAAFWMGCLIYLFARFLSFRCILIGWNIEFRRWQQEWRQQQSCKSVDNHFFCCPENAHVSTNLVK